ncbi:type II toxin-antitoxin system PemK/MazF family toxin [Williamsoniiplasma lucivorax]|uniref:Uncharacterized protein n=1 Tax=Williamsoniiplasma lucivorax TaxID=209274 RepID=A0A2S5RDV0_9MOLU|nr:type II toxin-antitoxin system PemK/MazF family toxin [Williamsoniiplasma lucivorax]PPE05305.1 hypothetical protein ELUCI_v1c06410 [Williamsoniiplasma lucivorax]
MDVNPKFKYKKFDFIQIRKLHSNIIFEEIKNGKIHLNFSDSKYIKPRPALILKEIKGTYIVIPLTSRPLINENSQLHKLLRYELKIKNLKKSYLMFDSILRLTKSQIDGLYKLGNKSINISGGAKKHILSVAIEKYTQIFS